MRGVIEQLEWRLARVERCLAATMAQASVRMPDEYYEHLEEDETDEDNTLTEYLRRSAMDFDRELSGYRDEVEEKEAAEMFDGETSCGAPSYYQPDYQPERRETYYQSHSGPTKKTSTAERESPCIKHNDVGAPFSIKLMPVSFYHEIDLSTGRFHVKFPESKASLASRLGAGDYLFIYVMAPEKRIIGLASVLERVYFDESDEWPCRLLAEWEIGPKYSGLTFRELGLKVRPRIGDTIYSVQSEKAMEIADALRLLPDLTPEQLEHYRNTYDPEN